LSLLTASAYGSYIANERFTWATVNQVLAAGEADAVALGVPLPANLDLPARFRQTAPLNTPDQSTFYTSGPNGYTDYPTLPNGVLKLDLPIVQPEDRGAQAAGIPAIDPGRTYLAC
jgi:2,4-dienoyl-CoA reductase-like NADH-dependent reductase (Old Yellow Enzyme family)